MRAAGGRQGGMDRPEDTLARAERRVREGEERVARQIATVEEMDRDNHPRAAAQARKVLATLERALELARDHLRMERERRGPEP